jgi:hypothetical protein
VKTAPAGEVRCSGEKGGNYFVYDGIVGNPSGAGTVQYAWTVTCTNGAGALTDTLTGALYDGTTPLSGASVRLDVAQPKVGVEVSCSVMLTLTDEIGRSASCAQTVLVNPCDLGCRSVDLSETLLGLDGDLGGQKLIVEQSAKALRSVTKKKTAGAAEAKRANDVYQAGWNQVWSFPSVVNNCTNTVACLASSTADFVMDYTNRAQELFTLNEKLVKQIKKAAKKNAKALKKAKVQQSRGKAAFDASLKEIKGIPDTQSACS